MTDILSFWVMVASLVRAGDAGPSMFAQLFLNTLPPVSRGSRDAIRSDAVSHENGGHRRQGLRVVLPVIAGIWNCRARTTVDGGGTHPSGIPDNWRSQLSIVQHTGHLFPPRLLP